MTCGERSQYRFTLLPLGNIEFALHQHVKTFTQGFRGISYLTEILQTCTPYHIAVYQTMSSSEKRIQEFYFQTCWLIGYQEIHLSVSNQLIHLCVVWIFHQSHILHLFHFLFKASGRMIACNDKWVFLIEEYIIQQIINGIAIFCHSKVAVIECIGT